MSIFYLFDFDGTLVDSMPTYISAIRRILDENHISYDDGIIRTVTPLGLGGAAEYFVNELGLKSSKEKLLCLLKEYMMDAYFHTIPAKSNVVPVLKELKKRGAGLNVLTASPHVTLDACLKRLGIWDFFDNIWSCEDFSATKADPQIYLMAAQRLNTAPENVLFLDDNLHADTVAKSAGMLVCGVYDDSSKDYVEQMKSSTDYYIYDFIELLDIDITQKV